MDAYRGAVGIDGLDIIRSKMQFTRCSSAQDEFHSYNMQVMSGAVRNSVEEINSTPMLETICNNNAPL